MKVRSDPCGVGAGLAAAAAGLAQAPAAAASQVYRCPGPPVLYTDALSPQEAREKGCRTIEGTPITIIQAPRPRRPRPAPATAAPRHRAAPADSAVDPAAQRQRDSEARRILLDELRRKRTSWPRCRRTTTTASPSAAATSATTSATSTAWPR
jgi:hypothetical protein